MSSLVVTVGSKTFEIEVDSLVFQDQYLIVSVDGQLVRIKAPASWSPWGDFDWLMIDDRPYELIIDRDFRWIKSDEGIFSLEVRDRDTSGIRLRGGDGRIKAPIPGLVTRIMVSVGQDVEAGQTMFILEAMKMENEIRADQSGKVKSIHVLSGQSVSLHEVLAEIT